MMSNKLHPAYWLCNSNIPIPGNEGNVQAVVHDQKEACFILAINIRDHNLHFLCCDTEYRPRSVIPHTRVIASQYGAEA